MALRSVGLINGLTEMVNTIKSNISKKFKAFYLKRVHEVDIAPTKTFSFDFEICSPGTSNHRRSVSKFKALVAKALLKNNPVVALAATEFLPLENSNSNIRINLFELEMGSTMPPVNAKLFKAKLRENRFDDRDIASVTFEDVRRYERLSRAVIESSVQLRSINRYTRYLEYLARKNGVPVVFRVQPDNQGTNSNSTSIKYKVFIEVIFTGWVLNSTTADTRYRQVLAGATDDEVFHARHWSTANIGYMESDSKFHVSKFFLHLDKVLKVVNTLTRKIDYGYSAFSFRTT